MNEEDGNTLFRCCIIAAIVTFILSFIFLTVAVGVGWGLVIGPMAIVLTVALGLTPILMFLSVISFICRDNEACKLLFGFMVCFWFLAEVAASACSLMCIVGGCPAYYGVDEQPNILHIGTIVAGSFGFAASLLCFLSGIYAVFAIGSTCA